MRRSVKDTFYLVYLKLGYATYPKCFAVTLTKYFEIKIWLNNITFVNESGKRFHKF